MSALQIDIVSDVVCPWCLVGYRQLAEALEQEGVTANIHWHPFELNPEMAEEGEHLTEHMGRKYGSSESESTANRQRLIDIGLTLGIEFDFFEDSRIYPTFRAHQLLAWAGQTGHEHQLKLALFDAYFTNRRNINDIESLLNVVESVGLNVGDARRILAEETYTSEIRQREANWTSQGIQAVPAMIFNERYLLSGAQGVERYSKIVRQIGSET